MTEAGMLAGDTIVLIEDKHGESWTVHYRYGLDVRTTLAEKEDVAFFMETRK
jgi:hypothetical protein